MKKKDLPELKLNKRTIANLNSMEMKYVVGGNGDDEGISKVECDPEKDTGILKSIKEASHKITLSLFNIC